MTGPADIPQDLERDFEDELERLYHECAELGYRPTRYLAMLRQHGARETAYRIFSAPDGHEGFTRVMMLGRPDLTVEAVALQERFREFFTEEQLAVARRRLGR